MPALVRRSFCHADGNGLCRGTVAGQPGMSSRAVERWTKGCLKRPKQRAQDDATLPGINYPPGILLAQRLEQWQQDARLIETICCDTDQAQHQQRIGFGVIGEEYLSVVADQLHASVEQLGEERHA